MFIWKIFKTLKRNPQSYPVKITIHCPHTGFIIGSQKQLWKSSYTVKSEAVLHSFHPAKDILFWKGISHFLGNLDLVEKGIVLVYWLTGTEDWECSQDSIFALDLLQCTCWDQGTWSIHLLIWNSHFTEFCMKSLGWKWLL